MNAQLKTRIEEVADEIAEEHVLKSDALEAVPEYVDGMAEIFVCYEAKKVVESLSAAEQSDAWAQLKDYGYGLDEITGLDDLYCKLSYAFFDSEIYDVVSEIFDRREEAANE